MNVNKIRLIHFRNFWDVSLDFHSSLNVFIGNNAQGKTNIIESIYTLLRGASYRSKDDCNLINWKEKKSYLLGEVQKDNKECFQINILIQNIDQQDHLYPKTKKVIKVNKKYQKKSWLLQRFNPVIFTPEDLQIVKSSPTVRRKFLDEVIINLNPIYDQYLKDYNRILFQRNILLKNEKKVGNLIKQLSIWDEKIVELGTLIILYRIKTLQLLNQKVKSLHQMMTENKETLKLKYNSNVLTSFTEDKEEISRILKQKINNAQGRDFKLKVTTVGPHRDDYFIINNKIDLGIYGSQGQQRTAVLALKMAELEILQEKENEYPPLLLDDVMSELDLERRRFLMQLIIEKPMQTFITNINPDDLTQLKSIKDSKVFRVRNGQVEGNEQ
ncbi:MAG: DNA replication and repair protein RecF [Atribacteria bacterium 34_128]|nr:MAG: DNA replication and repair protein RecF [Atribacteria bacterium 34_128]